MERLKGKTAMVVGAGSIGPGWGNGKATAVTFAREGAQVFCVDRNAAAAEETAKIITGEGGKATAFTADVSRAADVEAMVAACLKAYGRIDVLDNNVGIAEMGSVVEVTEADWDRVFAVNLKSAFLAMKHVIPVMEKQGGGSIINISSIASIRHLGISYVTYGASKAAMNQMTRTTAVEFARNHVRVNCILPGLMKTPMVEHSAGLAASYAKGDVEAMWRARDAQVPMGHMGDAWDVANAALFLASDESKYVTGLELVVDGGITEGGVGSCLGWSAACCSAKRCAAGRNRLERGETVPAASGMQMPHRARDKITPARSVPRDRVLPRADGTRRRRSSSDWRSARIDCRAAAMARRRSGSAGSSPEATPPSGSSSARNNSARYSSRRISASSDGSPSISSSAAR